MILFIIESIDNDEDRNLVLDIYEKYAPWMRLRITRLTKNSMVAEDLTHDCIVNLIRHVDKLRTFNEKQMRGYLAVTADNAAKNYFNKLAKERHVVVPEEELFDKEASETEVQDLIELKLTYEAAKENLKKLPKRDHDLLIMKYGFELSNKEIAEIMGIKEESVKMTVYRSARKLEQKMRRWK